MLLGALMAANDTLRQAIVNAPELEGMSSTMVSVVLVDSSLYWIGVGDSHVYRVRDR